MPSLRSEVADISKQKDSWLGLDDYRKRRRQRTPHTPIEKRKRVELGDPAPIRKRRKVSAKGFAAACNEVKASPDSVKVPDRDYLAYLQYLKDKESNLNTIQPDDNNKDDNDKPDDNNKDDKPDDNGKEDGIDPDYKEFLDKEDDIDPDYKEFLDNSKQCGYSYVLELKNSDGTNVLVKYEEDIKRKRIVDAPVVDNVRKQKKKQKQKNPGADTRRQQKEHNVVAEPNEDAVKLKIPKTEPLDNEFGRSTATRHQFISNCSAEAKLNADESYLNFLDNLWVTDDALVYELGDVVVKYEDYDNYGQGVEIGVEQQGQRVFTNGNEKIFTPDTNQTTDRDEDDSDSVQILDDTSVKLHYKEKLKIKLREALQIPFNENELEEKLKAAGDRKPLERARITRGRVVSYATDRASSSYLDLHHDLAGMLRSADPEKSLALLRCLFFYYENVSHQGSFIPWRNPESWLHELICSCGENLNCPMKHHQSTDKEVWDEDCQASASPVEEE